MKKTISVAVIAALMAIGLALPASAISRNDGLTLGEQITTNTSYDYRGWDYDIIGNIVATIVAEAGAGNIETDLGAALDPNADLTVFLPNDWAFKRLAYDLTGKWIWKESKVIPALLDAVDGNLQLVNDIVEYHVVGGTIDSSTALEADGASLTTVQGESFEVDVRSKRWARVKLIDNDPDIRNARLIRWDLDNFASNGVWHGISRVLLPIDV